MKKLLLLLFLIPNLVTAASIQDYFDNNPGWSADTKEIIYLTTRCSGILQVVGQHRIVVGDAELGSVLLEDGRDLGLRSAQLALDSGLSEDNIKDRMIYWMKKYAEDSISNTDNYNNIFVGDFADDFKICYQLTSSNQEGLIEQELAEFEAQLEKDLARQAALEAQLEAELAAQEMMAEMIADEERAKRLAEFQAKLEAEKASAAASTATYQSNTKPSEAYGLLAAYAKDTGWKCKSGYIKSGNSCIKLPANAHAVSGGGWVCNDGYEKAGIEKCKKSLMIPANAHASGSTWACNRGYTKTGNSCETVTNITENTIEMEFWNSIKDSDDLEKYQILAEIVFEMEFWNSIKDSDDLEEYRLYLEEYPEGKFAKLAELRINNLSDTTISGVQAGSIPKLDYGHYYALVIGNDSYIHLKTLSNAVNDANAVASLLRSKYQFNVNVLTNATRAEIVSALNNLRKTISAKDNILIYYAGHGWLDKDVDEGFWLPIDAAKDDEVKWIANDTIMRNIRHMKAKHVIVVADSCFSGTLIRGIKIREQSSDYLKEIVEKKSRTVLTSGGLEPVSDVGGGNNSVFAAAFMRILNENTGVLDGHQLFTTLRKQVRMNADQLPEYGDIRKAGHDGGDFLFVRQ